MLRFVSDLASALCVSERLEMTGDVLL